MKFLTTILLCAGLALAAAPPPPAAPAAGAAAPAEAATAAGAAVPGTGTVQFAAGDAPADPGLRRLLEDYVGLYRADRLSDWKQLLHERVSVADPRPDGSVRIRGLDEFFTTQQGFFASGRRIGERLEEVRVAEGRRIARVSARFVFVDEGEERPGRLGLHLVETGGTWRIVAIVFSYDRA
jgi:hypothetical protein